ncbi:LOW QUALITY PROTEIN: uncharacterized protein Dsimw501_GD29005 [Drosophila simulans]|uniref:Uncharacterized protein n=1 Tax=Drosophila simulans TaxID=7240 RepID=A0A0J9U3J6_DROSI|nr:LOW QUALITY PROTEIN: uncharacterized protein Dsimw501_GD29005 [Drosophila simulans]
MIHFFSLPDRISRALQLVLHATATASPTSIGLRESEDGSKTGKWPSSSSYIRVMLANAPPQNWRAAEK